MRRFMVAICLVIAGGSGAGLAAHPVLAASLCVGGPGCYPSIQAALNAAHDGDVIHIGAGTFQGGITIAKSVTIIGAGAAATVIRGGGPVVTIGQDRAPTEPTVSISNVTITGGDTTSSQECGPFLDLCVTSYYPATALGGGILVPPAAGLGAGATVTISNSAIRGNRAAPTMTVPSATHSCLGSPCPFGEAAGGGIDNWGTMTLRDTVVNDNQAGGPFNSEAIGGGIVTQAAGRLTLISSIVTGNHATSSPPSGRFAVAGGIEVDNGPFTIESSTVSNNDATLSSTYPASVTDTNANSGGILGPGSGSETIDNTRITGNVVSVTDRDAGPAAFDAGLDANGATLLLRNSDITGNRVIASVASTDVSGPDGNALEIDGQATVSDARVTGNSAIVTATSGTAGAVGAIANFATAPPALITNSEISGNTISASSPGGIATVQGSAIVNSGALELRNDQISENRGTAAGASGSAQGGAIYNGNVFGPPLQLTIGNTAITYNTLRASSGLTVQGGGLYTPGFPVTLSNSVIANNVPDQCFGC